jgi:hypothetical protein
MSKTSKTVKTSKKCKTSKTCNTRKMTKTSETPRGKMSPVQESLKARDEMNVSCNVTQVRHGRQVR